MIVLYVTLFAALCAVALGSLFGWIAGKLFKGGDDWGIGSGLNQVFWFGVGAIIGAIVGSGVAAGIWA